MKKVSVTRTITFGSTPTSTPPPFRVYDCLKANIQGLAPPDSDNARFRERP